MVSGLSSNITPVFGILSTSLRILVERETDFYRYNLSSKSGPDNALESYLNTQSSSHLQSSSFLYKSRQEDFLYFI